MDMFNNTFKRNNESHNVLLDIYRNNFSGNTSDFFDGMVMRYNNF